MTVLVVFESMFGSTKAVAQAVADGLRDRPDSAVSPSDGETVVVEEVGALVASGGDLPPDVSLLVVGAPTHAFGMSRAETRADAARLAPDGQVVSATGVREWLESVTLPAGLPVAAFGTKVVRPRLPGSAASAVEKTLRRRGGSPVLRARSFGVHGKADGLADGELAAARGWGKELRRATPRG